MKRSIWIALGALQFAWLGASASETQLVSARDRSIAPISANGASYDTAISANGRITAFSSFAVDLAPQDTNERSDLFLHDRSSGALQRIVAADGEEANSDSGTPSLSADGRFVAFATLATNLAPADTNDFTDVLVYDRAARKFEKISLAFNGTETDGESGEPAISENGRYVAFSSTATNIVDRKLETRVNVYLHDRQTGITTLVNVDPRGVPANADSFNPSISADGRFIAFQSYASNLVPGDTNEVRDVFVIDRQKNTLRRVSVSSDGAQGNDESGEPAITPDGRYVAFSSLASNFVPDDNWYGGVFLHDLKARTTTLISSDGSAFDEDAFAPTISADARYVAYSAYYSPFPQIFLRDRVTGTLQRVTDGIAVDEFGNGAITPALSADARILAFSSDSPTLVEHDANAQDDTFHYELASKRFHLISKSRVFSSTAPRPSANMPFAVSERGRHVAFYSLGGLHVRDDTNDRVDSFLRDRLLNKTTRQSVSSEGEEGNWEASYTNVSANGRYTVFVANSNNLVPDDTNFCWDAFVRDITTGQVERGNVASDGSQAEGDHPYCSAHEPVISADGRYVAFTTGLSTFDPAAPHMMPSVYVHDRVTGATELISVQEVPDDPGFVWSRGVSISDDGRFVAFESTNPFLVPGDDNDAQDIFVRDRVLKKTIRVSVSSTGAQSDDGSHLAGISGNGRYVTFGSFGTNLVPGDTNFVEDAFVHDMQTGVTQRVSVSSQGAEANNFTLRSVLNRDGSRVAFVSLADNLVPGDANFASDVFVRDLKAGTTTLVSLAASGAQGADHSYFASISADGTTVAFSSLATNLVPSDLNGTVDVFVRRLPP